MASIRCRDISPVDPVPVHLLPVHPVL